LIGQDFKMPSYTTSIMWNLWFVGDAGRVPPIPPLKLITSKYDLHTRASIDNYGKTKKVISEMVDIAKSDDIITSYHNVTRENMQHIYDYAFPLLIARLYQTLTMRPQDTNINTLANKFYKRAKQSQNTEDGGNDDT